MDNFNVCSDQRRRPGFTICDQGGNRRRCGNRDLGERVGLDLIMFSAQRRVIRVQNQLSHLTAKQFDNQGLRADNRASMSATRPLPSSGAMRSQSFTNVAVLLPRHHLRFFSRGVHLNHKILPHASATIRNPTRRNINDKHQFARVRLRTPD
jgi:hypothetical protein